MDEEKSETLVDLIEDYIDIKRLAEAILKEAEGVTITGSDVKPYKVVLNEIMNQASFKVEFRIAQIQAKEAKIEAEERKLERLEKADEKKKK